jgi:hypothetical protein
MGAKMACSEIVQMNKTTTIDTPYTKLKSVHVQYVEE